MRRFLALSLSLLVAACATRPTTTAPVPEQPREEPRSGLVGMTTEDLVRRFGTPALQIREGESLKLQFRDAQCVLDAYLYPGRNGAYHVTYVDTRTRALGAIDQAACVSALEDR
jgi:hypothetical protein